MTRFSPPILFDMVFIDVSQFVMEPLRTGVQRVLIKVIEHAPRERIMPFCVLDETHVAILDPAIFDFGIRYFASGRPAERALVADAHGKPRRLCEEDMLIKLLSRQPVAILEATDFFARAARVINLEAFSRAERSRFYTSCPPEHRGRVFHFIHDLLLFESPEVFPQLNWRYASDYVLLFEAYCAAGGFYVATPAMARKVAHYFNRPLADVCVVNFGGDLAVNLSSKAGGEAPVATRARRGGRRSVVVVGTIEPRKYPRVVADALFRLAAYHPEVDCTIIGKFGWVDDATRTAIENVIATGRVRHHADFADAAVRHMMATADVGIYVSSHEGFGLPVIEFAALGVPIVTNDAVPAASLVGNEHATVLRSVGIGELVVAVEHRLAQPAPAGPYYAWTWADCARQIFAWREAGRRGQGAALDGPVCWQGCTRVVRALRSRHLVFDEVRDEVRRYIAGDALMCSVVTAGGPQAASAQTATLVEAMTELVFENRRLIHWADLVQTKHLLAEMVRALGAGNRLDGLSRAFMVYIGRPIDPRAASEAVRLVGAGELLDRIVDVMHSDEASVYLGRQIATALRHVVDGVREILAMCMVDHIDLFCLHEFLGMSPPSLQDVLLVEDLVGAGVDRIELLLYLTHQRSMAGDALDLFLEVAAAVCRERGTRIAGADATLHAAGPDSGAPLAEEMPAVILAAGDADGARPSTLLPRSFMREVPLLSHAFGEGWHAAEYGGSRMFRWMMRDAFLDNPDGARPVRELVLDVQGVYGAHEPRLIGWLGQAEALVRVEPKPEGDGWHVHLTSDGDGTLAPTVRIQALASGCPALMEGAQDARELSMCVTGATFLYRD